ncbi:hypothetical protein [Phyllobacterium zundukense]|nr:hypothetical protein [Phyllobacterium zundukense]
MTLYRFEFDEMTRIESVCGIELGGNRVAMHQARLAVQDSLIDANIEGVDQGGLGPASLSYGKTQIGTVRFADLLNVPK